MSDDGVRSSRLTFGPFTLVARTSSRIGVVLRAVSPTKRSSSTNAQSDLITHSTDQTIHGMVSPERGDRRRYLHPACHHLSLDTRGQYHLKSGNMPGSRGSVDAAVDGVIRIRTDDASIPDVSGKDIGVYMWCRAEMFEYAVVRR